MASPYRLRSMQARYYDPAIGRFLSVDPVNISDNGNPIYFNRYAYVGNDPIGATDPNGEALKLIKSVCNIGKRTYKNGGNLKGAIKDEALSYVENGATIIDPNASFADKAFAVFDLATGFGDEAKAVKRAADSKKRRKPESLQDQMTMDAAKAGEGEVIKKDLDDTLYKGWDKVEVRTDSVQGKTSKVHYNRDPNTGDTGQFKVKQSSTDKTRGGADKAPEPTPKGELRY